MPSMFFLNWTFKHFQTSYEFNFLWKFGKCSSANPSQGVLQTLYRTKTCFFKDRKPPSEMREHLVLDSIRNYINCIRSGRLRWFSHEERHIDDSVLKKCRDIVVEG